MNGNMTSSKRLSRLLEGKANDRPLYAAWGHVMNYCDRSAKDFAKATIDFELANGFDIIKIMSNPYYMLEDAGIRLYHPGDFSHCIARSDSHLVIERPEDWNKMIFPQVGKGVLKREEEAVKRVLDYFQGDVPVLPTIVTPVMWVTYAALRPHIIDEYEAKYGSYIPYLERYLAENEKYVMPAVQHFLEINEEYMDRLLDLGVTGFFYCSDVARDFWNDKYVFERFERDVDMKTLRHADGKSEFSMFHICGNSRLLFDEVLSYPVEAFNWTDQSADNPSFADIRSKTDRVLVGGIDENRDLEGYDRAEIKNRLRRKINSAIRESGGKCVISGGCAWSMDAAAKLFILKEIMDEWE